MSEEDEMLRALILFGGLFLAVAWFLGGFFTRVAGVWRDGERTVVLRQFGPWVWGIAQWGEGRQEYRGQAFWGRVRLQRVDFGNSHLLSLGFTQEQARLIEGKVTGHLKLRCRGNTMLGQFFGRKFSFETNTIRDVSVVQPVPRQWLRADVVS